MTTVNKNFAAYKVSLDGTQRHYDHVRGLTFKQARSVSKFPIGRQVDKYGAYTWSYGANDGIKF